MKSALAATGIGGVVTAAAAASPLALASITACLAAVIWMVCWIVANQGRTANTVAIITAVRGTRPRNGAKASGPDAG